MEYYLYTHVRLDTNTIFYVGIGTKYSNKRTRKQTYKRAFRKKERNIIWKRIVKETDYKIHIIREFDTVGEALEAETYLIRKYGRIIEKTGELANIVTCNKEIKRKLVKASRLNAEKKRIKTYKYSLDGEYIEEYSSIMEAAIKNNVLCSDIAFCIRGFKRYEVGGFMWRNFKTNNIDSYETILNKHKTKVLQYDLNNNFIKKWDSSAIAAKELSICRSAIRNVLCGISYSCNGFKWVYKEEDLTPKHSPLCVYDKSMSLIGCYFSIRTAEEELNIPRGIIGTYLRRGSTYQNYIFKR